MSLIAYRVADLPSNVPTTSSSGVREVIVVCASRSPTQVMALEPVHFEAQRGLRSRSVFASVEVIVVPGELRVAVAVAVAVAAVALPKRRRRQDDALVRPEPTERERIVASVDSEQIEAYLMFGARLLCEPGSSVARYGPSARPGTGLDAGQFPICNRLVSLARASVVARPAAWRRRCERGWASS